MKYSSLKKIILEYNFKDISTIFGDYFDSVFKNRMSFKDLYFKFEANVNAFKKENMIDEVNVTFPLLINTYSKLKRYIEKNETIVEGGGVFEFFTMNLSKLIVLVSFFKKFPERLKKVTESDFKTLVYLIQNYESLTMEELLSKYISKKTFEDFVENYIFPTYVGNRIAPIYSDDEVEIYKPTKWAECRYLGSDTHWCISSSSAKENFAIYHDTRNYDVYFIFEKNKGTKGKMAFLIKRDLNLNAELEEIVHLNDIFVNHEKDVKKIFKMMKATFVGSLIKRSSWFDIRGAKDLALLMNQERAVKVLKLLNEKIEGDRSLMLKVYRKSIKEWNLKNKKMDSWVYDMIKSIVSNPLNLLYDILRNFGHQLEYFYFITEKYLSGYDDRKERLVARIATIYNLDDGKTLLKLMNDYDYLYSIFFDAQYGPSKKYSPFSDFDYYAKKVFFLMLSHYMDWAANDLPDIITKNEYVEIKDYSNGDIPLNRVHDYLLRLDKNELAWKYAWIMKLWWKMHINTMEILKTVTFDDVSDVKDSYEAGRVSMSGDPSWFVLPPSTIFNDPVKSAPLAHKFMLKSDSLMELYMNIIEYVWGDLILDCVRVLVMELKEHGLEEDVLNWVYAGSASHFIMKHPFFRKMYEVMEQDLIKE